MLSITGTGQKYVEVSPWLVVFPSAAVSLAVFSFNLLGEALRAVLDPRLKGVQSGTIPGLSRPCGWPRTSKNCKRALAGGVGTSAPRSQSGRGMVAHAKSFSSSPATVSQGPRYWEAKALLKAAGYDPPAKLGKRAQRWHRVRAA
jgi:hypothetical protein